MFIDLLPFEANQLFIYLAAFGALLCVAAYIASWSNKKLAAKLTRYARCVATATTLCLVMACAYLVLVGETTAQQLGSRATTSFSAWGEDVSSTFRR